MAFNNVRVPRDSLLGKYSTVTKDGEWKVRGNLKILYAAMMFVRESILEYCGEGISVGCQIALRYSNVRTQFKHTKNEERTIIDYQ